MSTYAIGDVQGCFEPLQRLLQTINFNPEEDELWFAGDLINRGPQSLETLRFIKALPRKKVVLGNHDLHLLARFYTQRPCKNKDTLDDILNAPDATELMDWLRFQPLVVWDEARNFCMTHAGLPPMWSAAQALELSQEVEAQLQSATPEDFLQQMYGNQPDCWQYNLQGIERWRIIVNYLTRMRFIGPNGELDLTSKEGLDTAPQGFAPWFAHPQRAAANTQLLFGHWAALEGQTHTQNTFALDTGCVWGRELSALRLEDLQWFRVAATPDN